MIGLERGNVRIDAYDPVWKTVAQEHCQRIQAALEHMAIDVQHVGSTSVPGLPAKPIIDIAVAVQSFDQEIIPVMEKIGYIHRPNCDDEGQIFFVEGEGNRRTAHIHVVKYMSMEWRNYINFREYLKTFPEKKEAYADLKKQLAHRYPNDREQYTAAKADFICYALRKAMVWSYLGKRIDAEVDRPIGYLHRKGDKELLYPVNYGFIPGVLGGDGEELDVYLLGVNEPVAEYNAKIIGIAHRENDVEDKLIAAPEGKVFYQNEIAEAIHFQEQYYKTYIESINEKSAGAVVYTVVDERIKYLLIKSQNGDIGFPKGHIEQGETEETAALREIFEETSVKVELLHDFKETVAYTMPNGKNKAVVYFAAKFQNQTPKHNDGFEHNEYMLLEFEEALNSLTFDNMKEILVKANEYLKGVIL